MTELLHDRYRLDEVIGQGAMGVVWRAHDEVLDRPIAIKELRPAPGVDPTEALDRFLVEARAAARLSHPNIVGVHDVFSDGQRVLIVMELIEGPTLDLVVGSQGAQSPEIVRAVMAQVAQALAKAHGAGVIHRDLKPDNIFWTQDRAVVADFGLARIGGGRGTVEGTVMGTPGYMAPEQIKGTTVGPPADIFGWGAVAYYLASGAAPFGEQEQTDSSALAYRIVHQDPPPLRLSDDPALAGLIAAALSKDPAHRPHDGVALVGRLTERLARVERVVRDVVAAQPSNCQLTGPRAKPITANATSTRRDPSIGPAGLSTTEGSDHSWVPPKGAWTRRRVWVSVLAAIFLVVLAPSLYLQATSSVETVSGGPESVTVSPDGTRAYVGLYQGSGTGSVIDTATSTVLPKVTADVWVPGISVAITPDGTGYYATSWSRDSVFVNDIAGNLERAEVRVGNKPLGVTVSPDGTRAYVANYGSNNVSVIDTATNLVMATVKVGSRPKGVTVSADGTRVYVANAGSNNVSVIDTATNLVMATVKVGSNPYGVAASRAGTRAYVTNRNSNSVSVIDTATNSVVSTVTVGSHPYGVAVSPDNTRAYVANNNSNSVSVINSATNAVMATVTLGTSP